MSTQENDKEILFLIELNSFLIDCYRGSYDRGRAINIIKQDQILEPMSTIIKNLDPNCSYYSFNDAPDIVLLNKVYEIKEGIEKKLVLKGKELFGKH